MDRTKKAFAIAQKNGLIKMVNHQIKSVYLKGYGNRCCFVIETKSSKTSTQIRLPIRDIFEFVKIFNFDADFDVNDEWDTNQIVNRYVRLCYYVTPENEMHQLANELEFVGVKHIIDDDPECEYTYIEK